jgi:hypothetical protein
LSFRPTGEILIRSLVFARDDSPRPSLGGPFDEVYPARGQSARDMLWAFAGEKSSCPHYALVAMAISSLSRDMRPMTSAKTIFIGIMMPLNASIGTVTSVPVK